MKNKKLLALLLAVVTLAVSSCFGTGSDNGGTTKSEEEIRAELKAELEAELEESRRAEESRQQEMNTTAAPETEEETEPVEVTPKVLSKTEVSALAEKAVVTVSVINVYDNTSTGSGFFIDEQGTLVTAYHVIEDATDISIEVYGGGKYDVQKIISFNPAYDLAVLQINYNSKDYLKISEEVPVLGANIYTLGSSLGTLEGSFTAGIVSSTSRKYGLIDCLQTDASISSGNSGGPAMNDYGEVVGVVFASYENGQNLNLLTKISQLSMLEEKNFSMNELREWYSNEYTRSYTPYILWDEEGGYQWSTVNRYDTVTSRPCLGCVDEYDEYYDGYQYMCRMYLYDYGQGSFDQYISYIKSLGFEYEDKVSEDSLIMYTYYDQLHAYEMTLIIDQSTNELIIMLEVY